MKRIDWASESRVQDAYNPMRPKTVSHWKDWSGRRDLNPGPPEPHLAKPKA